MKEQLVSLDVAVMAKEKGFNEVCRHAYRHVENEPHCFDNGCSLETIAYFYTLCPTQSLLQKWLRDNHNIAVIVSFNDNNAFEYYYFIHTNISKAYSNRICSLPFKTNTYEEALEAGLKEALKLIK